MNKVRIDENKDLNEIKRRKKGFWLFFFLLIVTFFFANQFNVFADYAGEFAFESMSIKENETNRLVFSASQGDVRLVSDNPHIAIVIDNEIIGINPGHTVIRLLAPNGKLLDTIFIEIKPQVEPIYIVVNGIEYIYEQLPKVSQLIEPELEKHEFIGWRYQDDRQLLSPGVTLDPNRPVIPVFERIPDVFVEVTFMDEDFTVLDIIKVISGSALSELELPKFIGFLDQRCPVQADAVNLEINEDVTLILYEEPPFECDDDSFVVFVEANDFQVELILTLSSSIDDIFVPTIPGFEMVGFTKSLDETNEFITDFSFNNELKDLNLIANYEPLIFVIELALETRLLNPSIVAPFNTPIVPPEDPTRGGYTFVGWTLDKEGTIPFVFDVMPAQNFKVYPQWSVNTYTLTLHPNNGDALTQQHVDFFEDLVLSTPTRVGFSFLGWYLDEALTIPLTRTKMPAEDLNLYAKWDINIYTVTFVDLFNRPLRTTFVGHGETAPAPSVPNVTSGNTLYIFRGWDTPIQNITNSRTIKALYNQSTISSPPVQSAQTITINFESNGGTAVSALTQNEGTPITLDSPTRTGYTFDGWFEEVGLTTLFNATIMPASDLTLYAKWTANTYMITFDANGGTGFMQSLSVSFAGIVSVPAISGMTRNYYDFVSWNTLENGTGVEYFEDDNFTMNTEGVTLYAIWLPTVYTITYDLVLSEVDNSNPISYTIESGIITLTSPSRIGYTFNHWTLSSTQVTSINASVDPQNITLVAAWTPNIYTIDFNPGREDVTLATTTQTLTYDTNTSLSALNVSASPGTINFVGWSLVSGGSVTYLDKDSVINLTPSGSITLYAIWQNENEFTVIFDSNGGTEVSSVTVVSGSTISAPTEPTKIGHTFSNWYLDSALTALYSFNSPVTENIHLYAKWDVNTYTITFDANGGTGTKDSISDLQYNQSLNVGLIADSTIARADRTFGGWAFDSQSTSSGIVFFDGDEKLFNSNLTHNKNIEDNIFDNTTITLYAIWLDEIETVSLVEAIIIQETSIEGSSEPRKMQICIIANNNSNEIRTDATVAFASFIAIRFNVNINLISASHSGNDSTVVITVKINNIESSQITITGFFTRYRDQANFDSNDTEFCEFVYKA